MQVSSQTCGLLRKLGAGLGAALLAIAVEAQPIPIGQIGPFTGLPSPDAKEINEGARAVFQQVNRAGGIRGRNIELFELDDQFTGDGFASQLAAAMPRKPVALISPIGSGALGKLVNEKLLDRYAITVVNAIPGSEPFRKPGHPRLFHVRASDRQQLEKIVQHARTLGVMRLGVLYQDLPIGTAGLKVVQDLAQQPPTPLSISSAMAKADSEALATAAAQALTTQPQAVVVIGAPKFMADAVAALRKAGARQFLFALSYMPAGLAYKLAGEVGARGVGIAQTFPNPNGVSLRLQRDFQSAMRALQPGAKSWTAFHLEGYVSARVLVEGLRQVNGEISAESLARALKSAGSIDLGGYYVNFDKSNEGSAFVDIGVIDSRGKLIY